MKVTCFDKSNSYETYILAGDIGGTNTNIALVGHKEEKFTTLLETKTSTAKIVDFMIPLRATVEEIKKQFPNISIKSCCISAAGPVADNYCALTNADWDVDGPLIQKETAIPTLVVNDFIALSYGIPLLDINNEESIIQIPTADNTKPQPTGKTKAVIGAGTGLGVGFLPWTATGYQACPSEGGHFDFPAFDEETTELMLYLREELGFHPGAERLVSGQGLITIFNWLMKKNQMATDEVIQSVLDAEPVEKPYYISKNVENHPFCSEVHRIFRKIYGKMAGNYATVFLPKGGIYIAGGVISKDERHFLSDHTFINAFSINHKENISELLKEIPVYIVRDYSTSLLGAANAALNLIK